MDTHSTDIPELSPTDRIYGLSLLWKEVSYNFAFFDQVPDLDWDQAYREYIPRVLAAESLYHYYRELQRLCALLRDGHTSVHFPPAVQRTVGSPTVRLRAVQRRAIVVNVAQELAPQCPVGSEVVQVHGMAVSEYLAREVFPYISSSTEHILWEWGIRDLLDGPVGTEVSITVRTPEGQHREMTLVRQPRDVEVEWAVPRQRKELEPLEFRWLAPGLAYVALNTFMDERVVQAFQAILPELCESRGVVLDLRRNTGGNSSLAIAIARHLVPGPFLTSKWRTRCHVAAYKAYGQHADQVPELEAFRSYHQGKVWHSEEAERIEPAPEPRVRAPLAILIGHHTASAAEDFLVCLDSVDRGIRVGQRTFGSTGQPLLIHLPGGGMARVCTKRDTFPDGRDFVGYGIEPHVPVEPSVGDVLSGRDPVLERGVQVVQERMGG